MGRLAVLLPLISTISALTSCTGAMSPASAPSLGGEEIMVLRAGSSGGCRSAVAGTSRREALLGVVRSPDTDEETRAYCLCALGELRGNEAVRPLIKVLHETRSEYAARALGMIGDARAIPALLSAFDDAISAEPCTGLAGTCIAAVGQIGVYSDEVKSAFRRAYFHPGMDLAVTVIRVAIEQELDWLLPSPEITTGWKTEPLTTTRDPAWQIICEVLNNREEHGPDGPRYEYELELAVSPQYDRATNRYVSKPHILRTSLRNLGSQTIPSRKSSAVLTGGLLHVGGPGGEVDVSGASGFWIGPRPSDIQQGGRAFHAMPLDMTQRLAKANAGRYSVWWTYRGLKSNTLVYEVNASGLRLVQ